MISFPNCKINLGLNIIGKRTDGYHDLETVFYPLAIKDAVEIIADENSSQEITFSSSGNEVAGNEADNLCVKAYYLLKKDFPGIPSIKLHLHKHIPMGAGLGGGSSDASTVLLLLNDKFNLQIPGDKLIQYALQLGSDCPFFIINKPVFAKGRGEILSPVPIDLSEYSIMVVHPGIHVNTGQAFQELKAIDFSPAGQIKYALTQDISEWKNVLKNDFEKPVFSRHPSIKEIKDKMYDAGAIYSAMSGSGSSVFGIFDKEVLKIQHDISLSHDILKFPSYYFCQIV